MEKGCSPTQRRLFGSRVVIKFILVACLAQNGASQEKKCSTFRENAKRVRAGVDFTPCDYMHLRQSNMPVIIEGGITSSAPVLRWDLQYLQGRLDRAGPKAAAETVDLYVSESRYFGPHNPEAGHEAIVPVRWDHALRLLRQFNTSSISKTAAAGAAGCSHYQQSEITPAILQEPLPPWLHEELVKSIPSWLSAHMYRDTEVMNARFSLEPMT